MLRRLTSIKSILVLALTTFALVGGNPFAAHAADGQTVLIEAESFASHGGWKLDTQFIDVMGSPYLLAHGLGKPVADATTTVELPSTGHYHVFVRTMDWVAKWNAPGTPGRFQILIDGQPLQETFGTKGADWGWHDGGTFQADAAEIEVTVRDLTGFDGRCDAIVFTKSDQPPPNESTILPQWRRDLLGHGDSASERVGYDLVVVGGGYSGMGAAISAARMGCKVALIQNRPVLGGNGSSEIRVWAMGLLRRGKYPRVGEIIEEFCDHAQKSPGTYEEFGDARKEAIVRAEPNIDLFLGHHAYKVETAAIDDNKKQVVAVHAFDTKTNQSVRFVGRLFADCTGHGTVGFLAGADHEMTPKGRMGMSNMWAWVERDQATSFPETPWALDLEMEDFPYPRDHHGQWFWEGGFDKDPIKEAEAIRDWNLRAVFGAFNAMKNRDGAADHKTAELTWVAFVGGTRESRRLMGDVMLTQDDVIEKREFKDGCVPSTWSIDLHYPKKQFAKKFPDNPFISIAEHDRRIDRNYGYPVPYRCFYSRNVDNLFMAGRCVSVTHEALGTVRVMKTCGMMGEVVGRAARICTQHGCLPRDVYEQHWEEMNLLLRLPGKARAATVQDAIQVPDDALPLASQHGPATGLIPRHLPGLVVDDVVAEKSGSWQSGDSLKGFVGHGYIYASADSGAKIRFQTKAPSAGRYEVRVSYQPHKNRGTSVPVRVQAGTLQLRKSVDMSQKPPLENGFTSLGTIELREADEVAVTIGTEQARGVVHADAIQLVPVDGRE